MPRGKVSSKKGQAKSASIDAKMVKSEKEVEESSTFASISVSDDDLKEASKVKATKRSSGRNKNVEEIEQASLGKKPVAKIRAKKSNENEVIENETEIKQGNQETELEKLESEMKPKGKTGKTADLKAQKTTASKDKNAQTTDESLNEDHTESANDNIPKKDAKQFGGRKKKQDVGNKEVEKIEQKSDIDETIVEKVSKKSRNFKKLEENIKDFSKVDPLKKRGKASQKDKTYEKEEISEKVEETFEVKHDIPSVKKATKRGRAAVKTANIEEEIKANNADIEEVLPKKRSRKAPSAEKEVAPDKSKRGRGKKTDKAVDKLKEDRSLPEKEDIATNGQDQSDKIEEIEELQNINKSEPIIIAAEAITKARSGRKRAAPSANKKQKKAAVDEKVNGVDNELEDDVDGSKSSKTKKKTDSSSLNVTATKYNKADFELAPISNGQTADEPRFNLKISSWNVAGLRSWLKKEGLKFLEYEQPDIFCMQEIKCTTDQLPEEVVRIPGYHPYWCCMPGGYAGVAIYSKIMPINVEYGIGNKEFDSCGRIITAEYEKFFLINVYVPNSGRKLVNLEARMKWEKLFQQFVQNLDARKPVVICGDMNVSHKEHDLANPKSNTRNAGFTKEERDKMTELLSLGFIDTFRHLYPDRKGAYTFWTYLGNARTRNVGWRLDYFIVSERFIKRVVDNCIRSQCMGSDHCPITLFLKL